MVTQVWGQDSPTKGLRLIRFKPVFMPPGHLQWIGPVGEPDDPKDFYHQIHLEQNGWVFIEQMEDDS